MSGAPYTRPRMDGGRGSAAEPRSDESLEDAHVALPSPLAAAGSTSEGVQLRIVQAQEAERARIAREVHDGPAQALSNAIFGVESALRVIETEPQHGVAELRAVAELLRRELDNVRGFITLLRPAVLVERGLDGAIEHVAATFRALSHVAITTDLAAPTIRLREAEQTVVLRVVQEALQNVRKHAQAAIATIRTCVVGDEWIVEVADDGRGFEPDADRGQSPRSFGLQFMRDRADLIGARFDIRSVPDRGAVVRLAIPLSRKESG